MTSLSPRKKSSLLRRNLIVESAVRCFIEQGFHQTSIRDIAGIAGISVGNLYNHFASKKALIVELAHWESVAIEKIIAKLENSGNPAEVMREFVDRFLDYSSNPVNVVLTTEFAAEVARNSEIGEAFSKTRTGLSDALKLLIDRGKKVRQFSTDINVAEAPEFILDLVEGLALRTASSNGKIPPSARAELHLILQKYLNA